MQRAVQTEPAERRFHKEKSKETRRILVGVADERTRARIAGAVGDLGYEVVNMADGYHLTECLADGILSGKTDQRPSLIIVSPILPGCTGLSLLGGLRDLGWSTPVVFVIRANDTRGRSQAWAEGLTGVFIEPFTDQELQSFASLVLDPEVSRAITDARDLECEPPGTFPEGTNPGLQL